MTPIQQVQDKQKITPCLWYNDNCEDAMNYYVDTFNGSPFKKAESKIVSVWAKDKFGLSWQIIPRRLGELLSDPDTAKSNRVLKAMLQMHKIVIADLEKAAYD